MNMYLNPKRVVEPLKEKRKFSAHSENSTTSDSIRINSGIKSDIPLSKYKFEERNLTVHDKAM
jgi:hypothetical protein